MEVYPEHRHFFILFHDIKIQSVETKEKLYDSTAVLM